MRAHFATLDAALLSAYFGVTLLVGFWRRKRTTDDYLIAGRALNMPVFVATLVATWYGGILAIGEFTYDYGLANWTTQALPYYLFAVIFAFFLAPSVRAAGLYTIPDKLQKEYGRGVALIGALFAFILITPAPYIRMVGEIVSLITGWHLFPAMLLGTLFSVVYVYVGGFQSDVRINIFQFVLMFGGFAVALPIIVAHYGGYSWLVAHLPPEHLKLNGGQDFTYILVWFFIALWTFVDPGFHQRCYAAKTPSVAKWGILTAVVCWIVFDFLTTTTGLYGRAALPNLGSIPHELSFPILAERTLPAGVKGLFYIAMLATVMSTVVSYTFMAAMTLGRDFVWRLKNDADNERVPEYTRWGLILATVFGIVISIAIPSVVKQWYALGSVVIPGLLIPVLAGYAPKWKTRPLATMLLMVAGSGTALTCLLMGWMYSPAHLAADTVDFPFHLQPMYPGLAASALAYLLGRAWSKYFHGENKTVFTA